MLVFFSTVQRVRKISKDNRLRGFRRICQVIEIPSSSSNHYVFRYKCLILIVLLIHIYT